MSGTMKSHAMKADQGQHLDRLHATLAYEAPVTSVKQISATRARALKAMGIETTRDLLAAYPRRYVDMSQVVSIEQATIGNQCTLSGTIYEVKQKHPRPRLTLVEITLVDSTGTLIITCFNQPWLKNSLKPSMELSVSGKVEFSYGFKRMTNPLVVVLEPGEQAQGIVLPFHPASSRLSRPIMRRLVASALDQVRGLYDPLPLVLRTRYRLYSRYQALRGVHQPFSIDDAEQARRRLRYEELFFLEWELIEQERQRASQQTPFSHTVDGSYVQAFREHLPFELTPDQEAAVSDILNRMAQNRALNHLLLGDVGTGKTIVAGFALAAVADSGMQACMMGPTEVLVRQYAVSLGVLLDAAGITWAIITGSSSADQRQMVQEGCADGSIQVLFGTHALLEDAIQFACCSLVCIDEQQRFGVDQRKRLIEKAPGADVLSMTATPIPRSLALACYGGLSLSYLKGAPALQGGRTTKVCHFSEEGIAYDALRAALARGEQAYVICPLIGVDLAAEEEPHDEPAEGESRIEYAAIEWGLEHDALGTDQSLSAASLHAKVLQEQVVPASRVGLLHGRMPSEEKDAIMQQFRAGEVDVLVSTTVVEVGVDVANATVMIIEDADRFGLAQLHQLRGRVGRGSKPGQVFLVSRSKAPSALERLAMMEATEDGFTLSEYDLASRREGDIFGERQHGISSLRLVNVIRDKALIEAAYADARACFEGDLATEKEQAAIRQEAALIRKARGL